MLGHDITGQYGFLEFETIRTRWIWIGVQLRMVGKASLFLAEVSFIYQQVWTLRVVWLSRCVAVLIAWNKSCMSTSINLQWVISLCLWLEILKWTGRRPKLPWPMRTVLTSTRRCRPRKSSAPWTARDPAFCSPPEENEPITRGGESGRVRNQPITASCQSTASAVSESGAAVNQRCSFGAKRLTVTQPSFLQSDSSSGLPLL